MGSNSSKGFSLDFDFDFDEDELKKASKTNSFVVKGEDEKVFSFLFLSHCLFVDLNASFVFSSFILMERSTSTFS